MTTVLVPVASGSEEMETTIIVDVLRRAGIDVVLASNGGSVITASRGVRLLPDADLQTQSVNHFDAIAIPGGGPGVEQLMVDDHLLTLIRQFVEADKWVAAVCAGPRVLHAAGVLRKSFTCHPGVAETLPAGRVNNRVHVSAPFITSQGPGTSFEFALALVNALVGKTIADEVATGLILPAGRKY